MMTTAELKQVNKAASAKEEFSYDLKRMQKAVSASTHTIPSGLSREEKRRFILSAR